MPRILIIQRRKTDPEAMAGCWWFLLCMGAMIYVATATDVPARPHGVPWLDVEPESLYKRAWSRNVIARRKTDMGHEGSKYMRRHLLSSDLGSASGESINESECVDVHNPPPGYNSSCEYVRKNCQDKHELIPYLEIVMCYLKDVQVS